MGGDPIPAFAEHLMKALQFGGLEKQNLAEIVDMLSQYNEKGLAPVKVFPIGIPYPDGVSAQYLLQAADLHTFLDTVAASTRTQRILIFPKGIPAVLQYLTEVEIR
jgi:hypothetical protein